MSSRSNGLLLGLLIVQAICACAISAPPGARASVTGADVAPSVTSCPTAANRYASYAADTGAAGDTTLIMRAIGRQLQRDFRCATLLFNGPLVCGAHPQPCGSSPPQIPDAPALPRAIEAARVAAAGYACLATQCKVDSPLARFAFSFETPLIFDDSALVTVTVFPSEGRTVEGGYYEKYVYRVSKMVVGWAVLARYFESTGHFEYQRP